MAGPDSVLSSAPSDGGLPQPWKDEAENVLGSDESVYSARDVRQWYVVLQEDCRWFDRGTRIAGQFTPQQPQHSIGSVLVEAGGYGRENPILLWIGGQAESFSFEARVFSEYKGDNTAEKKLEFFKRLNSRDPQLGRPPLLRFFWGNVIPDGLLCFIESLGGISYDEIRSDGTVWGATLQISLKRFTRFRIVEESLAERTGPTSERTPTTEAKHGDTYEMIALRLYGDPLLGVLLRQMNPRYPIEEDAPKSAADLTPGERVKIYPKRELMGEDISPQCHVLRMDNLIAAENRRRFFGLRGKLVGAIPRK